MLRNRQRTSGLQQRAYAATYRLVFTKRTQLVICGLLLDDAIRNLGRIPSFPAWLAGSRSGGSVSDFPRSPCLGHLKLGISTSRLLAHVGHFRVVADALGTGPLRVVRKYKSHLAPCESTRVQF